MSDSIEGADTLEPTPCDSSPKPSDVNASTTCDTSDAADSPDGPGPYMNPFDVEFTSPAGMLVAKLHEVLEDLQHVDLTNCSDDEIIAIAGRTEQAITRLTFAGDRQLVECSDRNLSTRMGYRSEPAFHNQYLRIVNPQRRRDQMAATATFTSPTGAPLEPKHPALAEAFAAGEVGTTHIHTVLDTLDDIPAAVAADVKIAAERTMTEHAKDSDPAQLAHIGQRLIANLDPDGELTDDADRDRKRGIWTNRQRADGTSKLNGRLSPLLASQLSTILAAWAAPGMNNPDDPDSPTGAVGDADAESVTDAASRDTRTPPQRNHDALSAVYRAVLEGRLLGRSHRGLPIQVIVKTELSDLQREIGVATTATGHLIPVRDLLTEIDRGGADTWLTVFADSTPIPLFFGRGRRLASRAQRLVAFSRPDGHTCSVAGCDQPAVHLELHHADRDWVDGGQTDITELFGTCPIHNRRHHPTRPGHMSSRIIPDGPDKGRAAWRLNTQPGAPQNPERINRIPDIPADLRRHLADVHGEIHGPPPHPQQSDTDEDPPPPSAPERADGPSDHGNSGGRSSSSGTRSHSDIPTDGASTETADAATRLDDAGAHTDRADTDVADADNEPAAHDPAVRGPAAALTTPHGIAIPDIAASRFYCREIISPSSELEARLQQLLATL